MLQYSRYKSPNQFFKFRTLNRLIFKTCESILFVKLFLKNNGKVIKLNQNKKTYIIRGRY